MPKDTGVKFRAALEALAYLIALGVRQHEKAGQKITRITVSGGIARSALMCEILATRARPAAGAAAVRRRPGPRRRGDGPGGAGEPPPPQAGDTTPYRVADAVGQMVKFQDRPVPPNPGWRRAYVQGLKRFEKLIAK